MSYQGWKDPKNWIYGADILAKVVFSYPCFFIGYLIGHMAWGFYVGFMYAREDMNQE